VGVKENMVPTNSGVVRGAVRGVAAFAAVVALGGTALLTGVGNAQEHHDPATAPGILPPYGWPEGQTGWTPEQVAFATDLVHRTEAALPTFTSKEELLAQGYGDFGFTIHSNGKQWDHWGIKARNEDADILDPTRPESIVVERSGPRWRIEAALFILPSTYTLDTVPQPFKFLPGWHSHENQFCVNDGGGFVGPIGPGNQCSVGHPPTPAPMLHVWTVDVGCDHRFAGLEASGLDHCTRSGDPGHGHGTMPGMGPGGTGPRGTGPRGTAIPPAIDPPGTTTTTVAVAGTQVSNLPPTPPATAVRATARYTG
jgi:hypothetical protein